MKSILVLSLFTALSSVGAFAQGGECELAGKAEKIVAVRGASKALSQAKLNSLQQKQVMVAAQEILALAGERTEATSAGDAIRELEWFSGDESFLEAVELEGVHYTQIITFPGDVPMAVLFQEGSADIAGVLNDADLSCPL